MKIKEARELTIDGLKEKLNYCEEELFNLRFQAKIGQLSNPLKKRYVRRDVARLKTLMNEMERNNRAM